MRFSAEENYKIFNSRLVKSKYPILGVRVPYIRAFAEELIKKNEWEMVLQQIPHYHEDIQLQTFILASAPLERKQRQLQIEAIFPYLDNWQTVDGLCSSLKEVKKNRLDYWNWLLTLRKSSNPFVIRFIIVMYLTYFLDDYLEEILAFLESVESDHYYVKMAIAWAVSIAYLKNEEKIVEFLSKTKIDRWTYNKALQKITESNQVNTKKKSLIKKMKR